MQLVLSFLLPFKRHQRGPHAPNRSVTDSDKYMQRKLSLMGNTLHVFVREEEELELFIKVSLMEKRAKPGMCEVDSDYTHASLILKRQSCLSSRSSPPEIVG